MTHEQSVKRYKEWLKLREEGLTYKEIGDDYGVTGSAVGMRLRSGFPKKREFVSPLFGISGHHQEGRGRSRMLVRIRDNFTCQDCGAIRTLKEVQEHNSGIKTLKGRMKLFDVHHTHGQCGKNSIGYDSTKDLSKMVTLCHKCHFNRPEHKVKKGYKTKKI